MKRKSKSIHEPDHKPLWAEDQIDKMSREISVDISTFKSRIKLHNQKLETALIHLELAVKWAVEQPRTEERDEALRNLMITLQNME